MIQRNANRLISLLLSVVLVLGLSGTALGIAAGDVLSPDPDRWGEQGNNGWYFMYKSAAGVYRQLDYYDSTASINWQRNAFAFDPGVMNEMLFINRNSFFTGENGSRPVYCFTAPCAGDVTLSFETHGPDGVRLQVLLGNKVLSLDGQTEITFNTAGYTRHRTDLTVRKGDRIYLEGYTTGTNREGWVRNYSVTYRSVTGGEETELYAPDLDAGWGSQDNWGWHYLYQDLVTGTCSELPYIPDGTEGENFTGLFSADRVFPYCFIGRDKLHPAVNANAVLAFRAPKSGTVKFTLGLRRSAELLSGSPSLLTVCRGNETLRQTEIGFPAGGGWETLELTAELLKGEWMYFIFGCGGSNINGEVRHTEQAEYLSVSDGAVPDPLPVPSYEGFQIRQTPSDAAKKDLRFAFSLPADRFGDLGETEDCRITALGVLWKAGSPADGSELRPEEAEQAPAEYLDDQTEGRLQYTFTVPGLEEDAWQTLYSVRPYVTCDLGGMTRTFYGTTVSASVWDYLCSLETAYGVVTDPVTVDMTTGTVASAQGTLTVTPAYVAGSTWHQTMTPASTTVSGDTALSRVSKGTLLTQAVPLPDGSLSVSQTATVASGGIGGVGLRLSFSMDYDVILPAWGGVRLTREQPNAAPFPGDGSRSYLDYPLEWDAQMLLLQGESGGYLIYHEDDGSQFKRLWLSNDGTNFNFVIETVPQAPFTDYTVFSARPWIITAYEGDWTDGAALYKKYADQTFGMAEINAKKPAAAAEVQAMMLTDLDANTIGMLKKLAELSDPTKIALIVPGWRAELYDVNYPDYTPKEGIAAYIRQAQAMGYKVLLHVNLIGCDDDSPDYAAYGLEDDRYLDARTLEPRMERWTSGYSVSFWMLNPASPDWQDLLISRLKEVYDTLHVDGFHLDQSLLCYNDGRGLVNGMTSMQGTVALERRLAEALPECMFSGEGTNEINCRWASFLQRAPYGINSATGTAWSDDKIRQILPLDAFLWSGGTRLYHYPAMPSSGSEAAYNAWCRAGLRLGALPTLMRTSGYELSVQNLATRQALALINWYQQNSPVFAYARWRGKPFACWRTRNGTTVSLTGEALW